MLLVAEVGFKLLVSVVVGVPVPVVKGVVAVVGRPDDVEFDWVIENCCDWAKMVVR